MHLSHLFQFEFKIHFKQTAESLIWSALFSYVPQKGHRVYMDSSAKQKNTLFGMTNTWSVQHVFSKTPGDIIGQCITK